MSPAFFYGFVLVLPCQLFCLLDYKRRCVSNERKVLSPNACPFGRPFINHQTQACQHAGSALKTQLLFR